MNELELLFWWFKQISETNSFNQWTFENGHTVNVNLTYVRTNVIKKSELN